MILETNEHFYIRAEDDVVDVQSRVLKHGESFAIVDHHGDVVPAGMGEEGLFHDGIRHLSELMLGIAGHRPLMLSSIVLHDNSLLRVDLTNPDLGQTAPTRVRRGTLHISRSSALWNGAYYQRLLIANHSPSEVNEELSLRFGADFVDIFEVRGTHRERRGRLLEPECRGGEIRLAYEGLDGVVRTTLFCARPQPDVIEDDGRTVHFNLHLRPHEEKTFEFDFSFNETECARSFGRAADVAHEQRERIAGTFCSIESSNEQFNAWLDRSMADLRMMITETRHGLYPYAGVPWFSTVFGRDGIFTAMEAMWMNPALARGVLATLAATQAEDVDPERAAEPGKILHEMRQGEMAALNEIPFGRYYGTVDATPLFIVLAGEYLARSGDLSFIERIWPNIERALQWIETHGDVDGDGFVEYRRHYGGLVNQGWKDSDDSIFHADGSLAEGTIALCEVQGYVYSALRAAARLAAALGRHDRVEPLNQRAADLQQQFDAAFWRRDLGTYALALDGEKRPCAVRSSNAGHCLFSGIALPGRAAALNASLMDETSFSGWGIRTVPTTEVRYNPMSYHNGSIWPHDTAVIADGLSRYEFNDAAPRMLQGLFEASCFFDVYRMPELFCGFPRQAGIGPIRYPLACAPQVWAAASVYMLIRACLGLEIDAARDRVMLTNPVLPECLDELTVRNLRVGESVVDLQFHRFPGNVLVNILRAEGPVRVVVIK